MNRRLTPGVLVATLLAVVPASAQAPVKTPPQAERFLDAANGLSLDQALGLALAQEPSLRAARSQIEIAEAMKWQASLRPNPSISIERREEPGGTDNQTMVSIDWPLDLFRKGSRVAVAQGEVTGARFGVADRERLLAAEVRMRYGNLAAAVRDLGFLDEIVGATRRQHDLLRARAELGASPPLERDLLDVALRRLESERLLQAAAAEAASVDLTRVLGLPPDAKVTLRETLEDLVRRESPATAGAGDLSTAAEQRADVREAVARIDIAAAKIDRAEDSGRFDVSLFGNYIRMDAGFPQQAFGADGSLTRIRGLFNYVSIGAMVTIPLLDRNQGMAAAARAERAGAEAARDAALLSARAEVAAARARHELAQRAVDIYTGGARALARQNLTVVRQTYELGRLTVFDVMSEERRYLDVELAYTQALRAAYEARTALERALGERR